jgi:nucleoside-diphosphate-sugar epimerase
MARYVVVGAGPVGRETARLLAEQGDQVRLVSRSGTGVGRTGIEAVTLDAADGDALSHASEGAAALFMCAMAPYDRWPAEFPPIMDGSVRAAERVGARLLIAGNVYGYGEHAPSPLTPNLPLRPTTVKGRVRVAMWQRALAAPVPALEIRASDYIGHGAASVFTLMALPQLLAGGPAVLPGNLDSPHAWSFTTDVARTLVAASSYAGEWGRAFHVPSRVATARELAARFTAAAGLEGPDLRALSREELGAMAASDSIMREVEEMAYLLAEPLILDASETTALLGVAASPLEDAVTDTLRGR